MKKRLVTPLPIPWYKKEDAIPAPVSGIDKNANCKNNEIPCILLKAVSDSLEDGVEDLLETDWAKKSSDIVAQATLTAVNDLIQL